MTKNFKRTENWFSARPRQQIGIRVLQTIIGIMLCFRIATELPFAAYLWGPNGIATTENSSSYFGVFFGGLFDKLFFSSMTGVYLIIAMLFVGALGLIFNVKTRLMSAFCAFSFIMLESRLPAIVDGGDNIIRLTLIFMILLTSNPLDESVGRYRIWLHNIGVAAIIVQLLILYETSGFLKATGEKWQNGTAMYIISNVEWFSLPGANKMFTDPYICTITTYIPVFFMIFFPFAVFSKLKFLWLSIGICLHIGIAYLMGLIVFSSVMIGLELFLITDREYRTIWAAITNSRLYQKLLTGRNTESVTV